MGAMVDDQTQKAIATTAIAMVIGAAIGYAVADQAGSDPAIGVLIGAMAGGGVAMLATAYSRHLLDRSNGRRLVRWWPLTATRTLTSWTSSGRHSGSRRRWRRFASKRPTRANS